MRGGSVGPNRYEITRYNVLAEGKGEKDGEDENNGTARAQRAERSGSRPAVGPVGPFVRDQPGPLGRSRRRSVLLRKSAADQRRRTDYGARLTGKHGYMVIRSRSNIFSLITDPFSLSNYIN